MSENMIASRGAVLPVEEALILPNATAYVVVPSFEEPLRQRLESLGSAPIAVPVREGTHGKDREDFRSIGVTIRLKNHTKVEGGVLLELLCGERVHVEQLSVLAGSAYAEHVPMPEQLDMDDQMQRQILEQYKSIVRDIGGHFRGSTQYLSALDLVTDVNTMIVWLARFMPMSNDERYSFLETSSQRQRSLDFLDAVIKQREALDWNIQINERVSERTNKYYREQMLRDQLKAIKHELGEDGQGEGGKKDYRQRIEESDLPEYARKAALEEVERLEAEPQQSSETGVIRNYLEFMLSLPWKHEQADNLDLQHAEQVLDEDHYGLEKVKKRIVEHLAVMQLRNDNKGSILLLVGPPGTGKTSLGKSIARALGRQYVRLSLGGIRDESEIRGHRRTYVGALPGRILNGMKQAGTTNPVMVLDEVDKLLPGGFSGDPSSALLEVLDPEQNSTFTDHYLDLAYDLSEVFFIATANAVDTIPAPLLDRMEVIQISSYTEDEKFHIAREHLMTEVLQDTGLTDQQLQVKDEAINAIITDYTREGGVRGLKKALTTIARAVSTQVVKGTAQLPRVVGPDDLDELLGRKVALHDRATSDNPTGVVTGLAWTPVGGEILFIEVAVMPGTGRIILTGQLGDVMQESAQISLSLLKSRLPLGAIDFKSIDIHVHVPSGATPKDGPSAGIALFTALASLFCNKKVDPHLAMTGELTLRGAVMPIGGLKEKLLAAHRAGITRVLVPVDNMPDLKDLPQEVRDDIEVVPVRTVEDVLHHTLGIELPRPEQLLFGAPDLALLPQPAAPSGE